MKKGIIITIVVLVVIGLGYYAYTRKVKDSKGTKDKPTDAPKPFTGEVGINAGK